MTENENKNDNFSFIKEKIKENPKEKKRIFKQVLYVAGLAVLFGLISCFVFTISQPYIKNLLYPQKTSDISLSDETEDEEAVTTETETKETETSPPAEVNTEKPVSSETSGQLPVQGDTNPQNWQLSDYQTLQNELYSVGKEADHFIVTVTGVKSDTDWFNNAFESQGQSTGILIADNGKELLVLTEYKIIGDAKEIRVTFINGKTVQASVKKHDGNTGLAVLSIDRTQVEAGTLADIAFATFGTSLSVAQGNVVIAVGSPLGSNYSISTGSITSTDNSVDTIDNTYSVLTTDIVGSSSSTGALLNLKGEIVGLVMQDFNSTQQNTLTALSISELKQLIEMLSNGKDIPYIGLKVRTVTDSIAADYGLPKGVYIKEVSLDSPALEAGLQNGDIIYEINGSSVTTVEAYEAKIMELKVGDTITIKVKRQGSSDYMPISCTVTAGQLP